MDELSFDPSTLYTDESTAWDPDYDATIEWQSTSPTAVYASAAPMLMDREPQPTSLLKYYKRGLLETYGPNFVWYPRMQWRGTCIGQSHSVVADIVMAINSLLTGTKYPGKPSAAGCYAGAKVDVGGRTGLLNSGVRDGAAGVHAMRWMTEKGGVLLGSAIGLRDGVLEKKEAQARNKADEQYAVKWAASREGVPKEFEDDARVYPIKGASLVNTVQEVRAAIGNLQPINLCSVYIPTGKRDSKGRSPMRRKGGHSTLLVETHKIDGVWYYTYMQTWWDWASGPCHLDDSLFDFKTSVCLLTEDDLKRALASRDCYTFWGVQGLEPISDNYRI